MSEEKKKEVKDDGKDLEVKDAKPQQPAQRQPELLQCQACGRIYNAFQGTPCPNQYCGTKPLVVDVPKGHVVDSYSVTFKKVV